jgi:signal transduction histidine kinase/ActR/RegA family two-component response regulator
MMSSSASGSPLGPPTLQTVRGGGLRMRTHLLLLIVTALVPVILFSAGMMFVHAERERSALHARLEENAAQLAALVNSQLKQTVAGLQTLGRSDALTHHDLRAFHALAGRLVRANQQWENLHLLSPGGEQLINAGMPFGTALPPLNRPDLPAKAAESRQPLVSDLAQATVADHRLTMIYVPIVQPTGAVQYIIAVAIEPTKWRKVLESQVETGMHAVLLDPQSEVITSTYPDDPAPMAGGIRNVSFHANAVGSASDTAHLDTLYGLDAYVASRKADFPGWTVATFVPVEAFDSPVRRSAIALVAGFLVLLLSGISLALLLGRRTTNSLSELVASVRAVASGHAPLPMKNHLAEVTQASQALTETAALLAARLRSEETAHARLDAADRAKNAFLALLGHELRNPLAPIRNAVQLMQQAGLGSEAAQWATGVIDRQSAHLARLVDDLLDVTRIDHGKIELRKEVVDLRGLLQGTVQDHRGVVEQAGVLLTLDVPSTPVLAHGDRIRLAQIIGNLLQNATKFTARGGRIVMRVAQEGPMAIVEVSDNGAGISPDNLERIFELFAQERPSGVGGNTGLGIGLALTRKLVELHGGTVRAASAGLGQGSTFRIELPAVVVAPSENIVAETTAIATDDAGARVLVVDDNQDSADTLSEMLSMTGFSSTVAYGGQAALHAVEHEVPDAVLLDIGLPDMSGYEVCQRIRHSNMTRQPVLIALTGWGQDQDRALAMTAGFDAHLTKPADPGALVAMLKELLARRASVSPIPLEQGIAIKSVRTEIMHF